MKDIAVLDINKRTKSKYLSIAKVGSTISAPKLMKKFIAAGTKIHHEKINPKKNRKPEPKTAGKIRLISFFVKPGEINIII